MSSKQCGDSRLEEIRKNQKVRWELRVPYGGDAYSEASREIEYLLGLLDARPAVETDARIAELTKERDAARAALEVHFQLQHETGCVRCGRAKSAHPDMSCHVYVAGTEPAKPFPDETKAEPADSVLDQLVSDISVSKLLSFSDHRALLKLLRELKGRRAAASETCVTPQAPIAKAMVSGEGNVAWTTLYAPGLPHGLHDLYCEPEAAGPYLSGGPYRVEYTRCDCHPETCSCMPWTLYDGEQGIARGTDCSALWAIAHAANRGAVKSTRESPADLVGALQDVVHTDPGPVRAATTAPPRIDKQEPLT